MEISITMQVSFNQFLSDILRAEEEMRCFISFSHSANTPYILKVITNLIKEYFSSSRLVYISVLLYSVLLLATFTET